MQRFHLSIVSEAEWTSQRTTSYKVHPGQIWEISLVKVTEVTIWIYCRQFAISAYAQLCRRTTLLWVHANFSTVCLNSDGYPVHTAHSFLKIRQNYRPRNNLASITAGRASIHERGRRITPEFPLALPPIGFLSMCLYALVLFVQPLRQCCCNNHDTVCRIG